MKNLLLSAYACDPEDGSEPGVGWQILQASTKVCDTVVLITRGNNVNRIREALTDEQREIVTVVGHDVSNQLLWMKKRIPYGTQAYYVAWQITARALVSRLIARHDINILHHATFAVDWMPTAFDHKAEQVPTIWGPVGGSTFPNCEMLRVLGWKGTASTAGRLILNSVGWLLFTRVQSPKYALCVAQNDDVFDRLSKRGITNVTLEPNAFISETHLPTRTLESIDSQTLVCVGRLLPWKGWSLAIEALPLLPDHIRIELYGDGPDRERLRMLAERRGVSHRVTFMGRRPRVEVLAAMASARALVFPSLHDSAATTVAEALTIGCPVIALAKGGSIEMIKRSGGMLIDPKQDIPQAIAAAALNPSPPFTLKPWSSERLPGVLQKWYDKAMLLPGGRAA